MRVEVGGILGLILLACVIYAIVKTVESSASTGAKVVWILVLLLLPLFGFIVWLLFGPRKR
ncbi:PLDc N-terminal domain-containing protein [Marinimicrobium sp. ABcell2]|uniref:PLDc N-terminal domain-containing protein n=1 Tax=Marinimicrobium sp. ABcell2 TaxID=3069751 RepID=UPI0027B05BEC|nr:PLDc N-terminal domain-containing protein [Marinimicrobium sp. ABcell2]MDQ2076635.1 PLDc N-terminal domain-containing protein [Marinimicrobium sp. ABcell2]